MKAPCSTLWLIAPLALLVAASPSQASEAVPNIAVEHFPVCNLDQLPDDPPSHPHVTTRSGEDGTALISLEGVSPACGFMLLFKPETHAQRERVLEILPTMVRKLNRDIFGIEVGEMTRPAYLQMTKGYPVEDWMDGKRRAATVVFQNIDPEAPYVPEEGAICLTFRSKDLESGAQVSSKQRKWSRAFERSITACHREMSPTPAAKRFNRATSRDKSKPATRDQLIAESKALEEAKTTLFPATRPKTWPPIAPYPERRLPPAAPPRIPRSK